MGRVTALAVGYENLKSYLKCVNRCTNRISTITQSDLKWEVGHRAENQNAISDGCLNSPAHRPLDDARSVA